MWRNSTLLHCWWAHTIVQLLGKTLQWFLKKIIIQLLYDPATPFLTTYFKNFKAVAQKTFVYPCSQQLD